MASLRQTSSFARVFSAVACMFCFASAQAHPLRGAVPRGLFRAALPLRAAQAGHDLGLTPGSVETGKLRLLFGRTPEREAELAGLLASQKDPRSPEYRHWLTPGQFGARFGATDEQLRAAGTWLAGQGFRVEPAPAGRGFLAFSGTVGQLNRAFDANVHSYGASGAEHHAATQPPRIPAALKGFVRTVSPLRDLPSASRSTVRVKAAGRLTALPGGARPFLSDPGNGQFYFTPAEAATVYNAPNSFNRNAPAGVQRFGAGVTIGIAGYSDLPVQDYLNYRRVFLGEASPASPDQVIDGIDPGVLTQHDGQVTLVAAELAAALAPKAAIKVYSSQSDLMEDGLVNAITRAVEDNQVSILSLSYSTCEYYLGAGGNYQIDELWKQAAAQGISVVVGTGDSGSGACDGGASATNGLAVNGFASTPFNLAVGGTDFDYSGSDFAQFLSPGASGTSAVAAALAGYVPESPWNDSISNNPAGPLASNIAAQYDYGSGPSTLVAGGGGGFSNEAVCPDPAYPGYGDCSVNLAGYPAPAFQSGTGQATRAVPDVALFAGTHRQYQATWAVCSDNQIAQANYTFVNCQPGADGSFSIEGAGGTEAAGPAFAGILALVSESLGGQRLGLVNDVLYRVASDPTLHVFHDISGGNNAVPCASGSLDCGAGGFLNGYDAGTGYDPATGLGSVDISALIAAWPNVTFTPTATTLTVNGSTTGPVTITHGNRLTLGAAIAPPDAAGTVSVTSATNKAGASVNEVIALTGGTGSIFTRRLPGGSYSIHGRYSGDVSHGPSVSQDIQLTVAKEDSVLLLSNEIQNLHDRSTTPNVTSIPYGTYGFVYVQPVGAASDADGPATGTVNLLNGGAAFSTGDAASAQTLNSVGRAAYPIDLFPPGAYKLGASYGGDASYNASPAPAPLALTVSQAATKLSAAVSSTSIDVAKTATITVTLDTDSTGAFPTGGIFLAANGTKFPGTVREIRTAINTDQEVATFQVPGSALVSGANTFTASYPGDTNYASSTATVVLTVTGVPPTFTMIGPSSPIVLNTDATSATGTVMLQSKNGFAGDVKLACSFGAGPLNPPECAVTTPVTLAADGTGTAMVTITAPLSFASLGSRPASLLPKAGGGLVLASLLLLVPRARRKAFGSLAVLLMLLSLGITGCGVHLNRHTRVTGNFTANITGTSGTLVVTTPVQVQVQ